MWLINFCLLIIKAKNNLALPTGKSRTNNVLLTPPGEQIIYLQFIF